MTDNNDRPPFRLAIRTEGEYINAYFADYDTMDGAILVASIKSSMLRGPVFEMWKAALTKALEVMLAEMGLTSEWADEPAPEHERSGSA